MKKYRKIWAVLLTLAMVLGMSMTTMAANIPSEDDKANITVENVEDGATVSAYQIIGAIYDDNGLVRYDWCAGEKNAQKVEFDNNGNVIGLDDTFITSYAKTKGLTATATATATGTTATLTDLTVGTYMILVTPADNVAGKSYNPMIASVNYDVKGSGSDNTAGDGSVNANSNWEVQGDVVYAKSSVLALTKTVDDDTKEAAAEGRSNIGEEVTFTVTTTIPSYSDAYNGDDFKFEIKDELKNGLKYASDEPKVQVGDSVLTKDTEYTLTFNATQSSFTISFKQDYLKALAAPTTKRNVVITYGAYATEAATVANPGVNTVTLTYSDSLTTTKELPPVSEKVYTFDITGAIKKVKEDRTTALPGATFTLYKDEKLSDVFATCTTNDEGTIAFSGLGALEDGQTKGTGVYYLKETAAPTGYTINDTVYEVKVSSIERAANGDITGYTVAVKDLKTIGATVKTFTYALNAEGQITTSGTATNIVNTKLSALPSTGGIGTTIFTIGGCAIMIAAAFLFFASRKKNENK